MKKIKEIKIKREGKGTKKSKTEFRKKRAELLE